jgi:hypothetical protein
MLAGEELERVHLNVWSAFVLGYGFAVGFLLAQMTLAIIAGFIFLVILALTH